MLKTLLWYHTDNNYYPKNDSYSKNFYSWYYAQQYLLLLFRKVSAFTVHNSVFTIHNSSYFYYLQQYLLLLFTTVLIFIFSQDHEAGEANVTATVFSAVYKVLLSTHRILNYIVSGAAKLLSLYIFRQVYMGHFLIVFPGSSTRREHFSTATRFSFQRHMA